MAWQYFMKADFACRHCGENLMDEGFIDKLDKLRKVLGFALPVTSGYRCSDYNRVISTTGPNGPHTTGRAADIGVRGLQAFMVLSLAQSSADFTGFGFKQHGEGRFIHLDDLAAPVFPRPNIWSYP